MITQKEITELFCKEIYGTDKADMEAEARLGTPFKIYEDTLDEIGDFFKILIDSETELLQHNLAYNATLNAQFMKALHDISSLNVHEVGPSDAYLNLHNAIEIAKTALTTLSYQKLAQ